MAGWERDWDPVVALVGTDLGLWRWRGADVVEAGAIRRWCEPLELDCPLHHDAEVARAHGHGDLVAPYTATISFALPALWEPGDPGLFADEGRDAQPRHSDIVAIDVPGAPPTTGFFVTDVEIDYERPARVGERVLQTGLTLLTCTPKETAVGRGAFMTFEAQLRTEGAHELLATHRMTTFSYVAR